MVAIVGMATSVIISEKSSVVIQNCCTSEAMRFIFSKSSANVESSKNMSSTMTPLSVPSFDVGIDELVDWTPEWLSSNIGALNVESANVSVVCAFAKKELNAKLQFSDKSSIFKMGSVMWPNAPVHRS